MNLSVVLPTLNCADKMSAHIASMEPWLDLVDELIAVDSHSEDGTLDIILNRIKHSNLHVLSHPRGLYQSWNHAIKQTRGQWIYISTIGDTITRDQLEHMLEIGEEHEADVVISPPEFLIAEHISMKPPIWPVQTIIKKHRIKQPAILDSDTILIYAMIFIPNAILGSSASNLYRGDHIRQHAFPTCFGATGDTAWVLRYALKTRFCFTHQNGSIFHIHSDAYIQQNPEAIKQLIASLKDEGLRTLRDIKDFSNHPLIKLYMQVSDAELMYKKARSCLAIARSLRGAPWYFRPKAIFAWIRRYRLGINLKKISVHLENKLPAALRQVE